MVPGFFAYPNQESRRLTIAILLALAVHGLLIFGLRFDWRLTELPHEPRLELTIAVFEPAEDASADAAAQDTGGPADQAPSPPAAEEEGGPTAEPLEAMSSPAQPPAPNAASEPATPPAPALESEVRNPPAPAKPSEPVITAPRPRAAAPPRRPPAEPTVRPTPTPKPASAPEEKSAPKTAPPTRPAPRQAEREEESKVAQTPSAPPSVRASPPRPETTAPGLDKTPPPKTEAAETAGKIARSARRPNGQDLLERGLEMARRDTAAELPEGAPGERKKSDASIMTLQRFYEENWARQVERSGVIPAEAVRLQLTSGPTLAVVVKANGSVQSITVLRSSGHAGVDQAARAMVYQAAPYAPFPPELRRYATTLRIVRQWKFRQGRLVSQ